MMMDSTNPTAMPESSAQDIIMMAAGTMVERVPGVGSSRKTAAALAALVQSLDYDIHAYSSYSANYRPEHIKNNLPFDQSSRWSSGSNNHLQYLTIKLSSLACAYTIKFGKYHKVHVCNLKEFKVYGGMTTNHMVELLHAGLRNDSEPETFSLKHKVNGISFPCRYIKIVPLQAWGANFNFSIWFLEVRGVSDAVAVDSVHQNYINYKEKEVSRLCLKHFRQRNYAEPFDALHRQTQLNLEDPLLTRLHQALVLQGDFNQVEEILTHSGQQGMFQEHISLCAYDPVWRKIPDILSPNGVVPCMRGGHQMCIDVDAGVIYLFGGWDGTKDLADFWSFSIAAGQWKCISQDCKKSGGPGARSCHKICFDPKLKQIYSLGRYVDPESRPNVPLDSDFWRFDVASGKWHKISSSTTSEGGPELIYDHQMVMDSDNQVLYVFGGRTIAPDPTSTVYSGLYAYSMTTRAWKLLRDDNNQPEHSVHIKSRIGHSMLWNGRSRELYIFAGQRNKDYLSDFYVYEIASDTLYEVSRDYSKIGGPEPGFTQRATIDADLGEFYVLSGLMREKNTAQETVKNSFWVYNMIKEKWTKVYQNENTGAEYWSKMANVEPCPRFAHQLVYDSANKVQYLFGGNPGEAGNPNLRLADFWQLKLHRPSHEDVLRRALFLARRQHFRELCQGPGGMMTALSYLQTAVSAVVDHSNERESQAFRGLSQCLFTWGKAALASPSADEEMPSPSSSVLTVNEMYATRSVLYESLLAFFPTDMREPHENLLDLVPLNY